jgi:hypothetical protein
MREMDEELRWFASSLSTILNDVTRVELEITFSLRLFHLIVIPSLRRMYDTTITGLFSIVPTLFSIRQESKSMSGYLHMKSHFPRADKD